MKSSFSVDNKEDKRPAKSAKDAAMTKLSYRMRTEKEIRDFLRDSGYESGETEETMAFLRECGYVDDEKYSKEYYLHGQSRGKALGRIVRELEQKGISRSVSRSAIAGMEQEPEYEGLLTGQKEAAMKIAVKMAEQQKEKGGDFDQKFLAKVGRRLASLGYDSSLCYSTMAKIKDYGKENE